MNWSEEVHCIHWDSQDWARKWLLVCSSPFTRWRLCLEAAFAKADAWYHHFNISAVLPITLINISTVCIEFHKTETPYSWLSHCQILTNCQNSFTGWFSSKFTVKRLLKIPSFLAYTVCCHTTLWNNNVRKQTISDKLQGSLATYLRCDGVVNDQIKKGLLLSLPENFFFKSVNISQSYK